MINQTATVIGTVDHITFYNPENGYGVIKLIPEDRVYARNANGTLTAVGTCYPEPHKGDRVEVSGHWVEHHKYGLQLHISAYERLSHQPALVPDHMTDTDLDQLRGVVYRTTYYNPENGWGVVKIEPLENEIYPEEALSHTGLIAVVGVMPELADGETIDCAGKWVTNETYGKQFKAEQLIPITPTTKEAITRYIADNVFGIGTRTADKIYQHFGEKTLEILDLAPERIREVPGLKRKLAESFIEVWEDNRVERQVQIRLQQYGISSRFARRIYDLYGAKTVTIVEQNPYRLAEDVRGIGFKKADEIAREVGIAPTSPYRLRAGLSYTLKQLANDGHTYMPEEELLAEARKLLEIDQLETDGDTIDLALELNEHIAAGSLRRDALQHPTDVNQPDTTAIYLPMFYNSEVGVMEHMLDMAGGSSPILRDMTDTNWGAYLADLAESNNVQLTLQQQSAVKAALTSKISVLTGGPGTGKTTTLRMVINALEQEDYHFMLASPTGRAAKRLSEATGRTASTIHRLLRWVPQEARFEHDENNPLDTQFVVVDESSMIDLLLFYSLLKAIPPGAHLLLVGDIDQLPSVGAGNVLKDVIASGIADVTRLNQIFRQDEDSYIITNAHRINTGQMPHTDNQSKDFFFFNIEDPTEAGAMIVDLVAERLKRVLGDYDPKEDIQVIAPMYKGAIGVNALNEALQDRLNPPRERLLEVRLGSRVFRPGDKVMQTKNNYEVDVFNGDIGFVHGINPDEKEIQINIEGRYINYSYDAADEQLIHAYCISTHRSQGSEYPVVVMPVMAQHYMMLQRNLLYTAITRAKQMVVLVGTRKAVGMAVNNDKVSQRYSGLYYRLAGEWLDSSSSSPGRLF